jgi:hypothetical protein
LIGRLPQRMSQPGDGVRGAILLLVDESFRRLAHAVAEMPRTVTADAEYFLGRAAADLCCAGLPTVHCDLPPSSVYAENVGRIGRFPTVGGYDRAAIGRDQERGGSSRKRSV